MRKGLIALGTAIIFSNPASAALSIDWYNHTGIAGNDVTISAYDDEYLNDVNINVDGPYDAITFNDDEGTVVIHTLAGLGDELVVTFSVNGVVAEPFSIRLVQPIGAENHGYNEGHLTCNYNMDGVNVGEIVFDYNPQTVHYLTYGEDGGPTFDNIVPTTRKITNARGILELSSPVAFGNEILNIADLGIWFGDTNAVNADAKVSGWMGHVGRGTASMGLNSWVGYQFRGDTAVMDFTDNSMQPSGTWNYNGGHVTGSGDFSCWSITGDNGLMSLVQLLRDRVDASFMAASEKSRLYALLDTIDGFEDWDAFGAVNEEVERTLGLVDNSRLTWKRNIALEVLNAKGMTQDLYGEYLERINAATTVSELHLLIVEIRALDGNFPPRLRQEIALMQSLLDRTEMYDDDRLALQTKLDAVTSFAEVRVIRGDIRRANVRFLEGSGLTQAEMIARMKAVLLRILEYAELRDEDRAEILELINGSVSVAELNTAATRLDALIQDSDAVQDEEESTGAGSFGILGLFGLFAMRRVIKK